MINLNQKFKLICSIIRFQNLSINYKIFTSYKIMIININFTKYIKFLFIFMIKLFYLYTYLHLELLYFKFMFNSFLQFDIKIIKKLIQEPKLEANII